MYFIILMHNDSKRTSEFRLFVLGRVEARQAHFGTDLLRCGPDTLDFAVEDPTASQWLKYDDFYGAAENKVIEDSDVIDIWSDMTTWHSVFQEDAMARPMLSTNISPVRFSKRISCCYMYEIFMRCSTSFER